MTLISTCKLFRIVCYCHLEGYRHRSESTVQLTDCFTKNSLHQICTEKQYKCHIGQACTFHHGAKIFMTVFQFVFYYYQLMAPWKWWARYFNVFFLLSPACMFVPIFIPFLHTLFFHSSIIVSSSLLSHHFCLSYCHLFPCILGMSEDNWDFVSSPSMERIGYYLYVDISVVLSLTEMSKYPT